MPPRQSPAVPERPADATDRADLPAGRARDPRTPSEARGTTGAAARLAEGPMALAFRLAREKKQRTG
jgi:hypothetical protein